MTDETMPSLDALLKRCGSDFMKELAEEVLQRLIAYGIEGRVGAGRYERNDERTTQRNGYRERAFDTRLGTLDLKIPKLRRGSYSASSSRDARPSRPWWRSSRRLDPRRSLQEASRGEAVWSCRRRGLDAQGR